MIQFVLTIEDFEDIYDSFPFKVKMTTYEYTIKATWILRIDDNENIYSIIYNEQSYNLLESESNLVYENNKGEMIKLYLSKDCYGCRCSIYGEIIINNTIYSICYWP